MFSYALGGVFRDDLNKYVNKYVNKYGNKYGKNLLTYLFNRYIFTCKETNKIANKELELNKNAVFEKSHGFFIVSDYADKFNVVQQ